jgi:Tfp pilus assembly protein PilO
MIVAEKTHKQDEETNILKGLADLVDNIILRQILTAIANFLWGTKKRLAWFIVFLLFVIGATFFWFIKIQPKIDEVMLMSAKVTSIESKQQSRDSLLLVINNNIKDGFGNIYQRFDSVDNQLISYENDFATLIHYVAKKDKNGITIQSEEDYLRREILDDHKKLK